MNRVLLLGKHDVTSLMRPADYLAAVEEAFRASKQGRADAPPPMHIPGNGGAFHAKGASYEGTLPYVALKFNGNFPDNPRLHGLPTIQGAIQLCDGAKGSLLAIIDSIEVTLRRTAAATALAARFLARSESETLLMCGCGDQAVAQIAALVEVLPIRRCLAFDIADGKAARFAHDMEAVLGIECKVAPDLCAAALASDVIVTCTTARSPILELHDVGPGAFIAAVGSDSPDKNEIAPALMASSTVVVDILDQCMAMGDLRHAIAAGLMTPADVHADLGDLVTGAVRGRTNADEITIFDSTGTALQDAASAALIYERATASGVGTLFALGGA